MNSIRQYTVKDILREIWDNGVASRPRDQHVVEIEYFQGEIVDPWSMYPARKYNIDYYKREMQWYLGANPYDRRICKHASMWNKIVQRDGRILSNYGYYWFGSQGGYYWALESLSKDPDTRQAYIAMNNYHHAFEGNKDFVCTKGIQFRIKDDKLNIHVAMRSTDAIYGLGTDLPCFWTLWMMMAADLNIPCGKFIFSSDSLHIYERHFNMVGNILMDEGGWFNDNEGVIPPLDDPDDLIQLRFNSDFGRWLTEAKL